MYKRQADKIDRLHNDAETKHMAGDIIKLLELFIYSSYGELFNTQGKTNIINLSESIQNNGLVLFLFDASTYQEDTKKVAKMVITDINSAFSSFKTFTKALCVFDEFGSYASSNLAETISLQRSQGMHAIIGTQSIATVKLKSSDTKRIAEELIACCNTFIIHALNHVEDAELFARIIGTEDRQQYSRTVYDKQIDKQDKEDRPLALGSSRVIEKFKINPQQIKELKRGEAIVYRKAANLAAVQVKIRNIFAKPEIAKSTHTIKPPRSPMPLIILITVGLVTFIAWKIWSTPPAPGTSPNQIKTSNKIIASKPKLAKKKHIQPLNKTVDSEAWVYLYNTTYVDGKCCRVDYKLRNQGPILHIQVRQIPNGYKMTLKELEALQ